MSIVTMLLRKMAKNRWLVASLLAGMCLCTALTSSMPIYKDAALERMLVKELEQSYQRTLMYPGTLFVSSSPGYRADNAEGQGAFLASMDQYWEREVLSEPSLSLMSYTRERQTVAFRVDPADPTRMDPEIRRSTKLTSRTHLKEHARLVDGRWPAAAPVDGVYEALVTDNTLTKFGMVLGAELVSNDSQISEPIRIVPVGVIAEADLNDPYWDYSRLSGLGTAMIVDEALFATEVLAAARAPIGVAKWEATFDYNAFTLDAAIRFASIVDGTKQYYDERLPYRSTLKMAAEPILSTYEEKETTLRSLLWSLNVPLYLLAAFYLYMVSGLLAERQRPEVAVLRSRGAGRAQIVALFAMEAAALAAIAFAVGPYLGAAFTGALGSSDSFMSFVQRKAMDTDVTAESYLFSGAAAAFSFVVYLIPVFLATKFSIVDQKRSSARQRLSGAWHRYGLDFVLLALSGYGLFVFRRRIEDLTALGLDAKALAADPILFAVPSLFILGLGLLLLRLYPWLIRLVYWLGKSRWSAANYSSLLLVGRRSGQYQAFMLFLILTVGTGLYSASAARTINGNMEDQIWYRQGAELALRQDWVDDAPVPNPYGGEETSFSSGDKINYLEPEFTVFERLPGVEEAARVFTKPNAHFWSGNEHALTTLMGIHTDEFGEAAWMKNGLLDYHFYDYLNLMAGDVRAVLISRTLAEQFDVAPGDVLEVGWDGTGRSEVTVYGIIDYFPTFNPNPPPGTADPEANRPMLIVGHLETIQNELALEPYDVWLKLTSADQRETAYEAMAEQRIRLVSMTDTRELIVESRNDPFRMAMNGVMSLGFLLSLGITVAGFLLYWVLTLQGRTLQFGIFRAMGIPFRQIVGMLGVEQLLTSGAAFAIGLTAGSLASVLYVPLFQASFDPGRIVPPFQVMIDRADTLRLSIFIGITLALALMVLAVLLKRVKLHQALRLGED
ncbi:ABC transporter permease [Paenibacillus sp. TRM 82003]|nr:ABC transporter permease [Paenibacillus sp. TRM 82003]